MLSTTNCSVGLAQGSVHHTSITHISTLSFNVWTNLPARFWDLCANWTNCKLQFSSAGIKLAVHIDVTFCLPCIILASMSNRRWSIFSKYSRQRRLFYKSTYIRLQISGYEQLPIQWNLFKQLICNLLQTSFPCVVLKRFSLVVWLPLWAHYTKAKPWIISKLINVHIIATG